MSDDLDFDMEVVEDDELDELGADGTSSSEERSRSEIGEDTTDRDGKSASAADGRSSLVGQEKVNSDPSSGRSKEEFSDRNTTAEWGALGVPPEDWGTEYLGDKFEVIKESVDPSEYSEGKEILLYSMPAYDEGNGPVRVEAGSIGSKKFRVPSHALLFPKLNITKKRFWLVKERHKKPALCSTEYWPLVPDGELNLEYYHQLFGADAFVNKPRLSSSATTNSHQRIKSNLFEKVRLPVPPLPEQRKIASVLSAVDQAIQKTEAIIEHATQAQRGLLIELLTEGFNDHDTRNAGALGEIPTDWRTEKLGQVADVQRGKFTHRPRNDPEFYDGVYPFIQTGEVVEARGELRNHSQTLNEKGRGVSKRFDPGTIIITIAGNIGDTAIATFPVYFPDSLVGITPGDGVDPHYLEFFLRSRQKYLNRLATETTQKNLNLSLLRPIDVLLPPLSEQRQIAGVLDDFDSKIRAEEEYKSQLRRLKKGLMQDLLTGEVRTADKAIDVLDEVEAHG